MLIILGIAAPIVFSFFISDLQDFYDLLPMIMMWAAILAFLFFLQGPGYRLSRVRHDLPCAPVLLPGGRWHFPARDIADRLRTERASLIFLTVFLYTPLVFLCLYAIYGVLLSPEDDPVLQAQGKSPATDALDFNDIALLLIAISFLAGISFLLRRFYLGAQAFEKLYRISLSPETDSSRGIVTSDEGVEIFIAVLTDQEKLHYLRRKNETHIFIPWRDIISWDMVKKVSRYRPATDYYRIVSSETRRNIFGALYVDLGFFDTCRTELKTEIERHLARPIETKSFAQDILSALRRADPAR